MNAISVVPGYSHSARQIALIQSTVARDCNKDEFDLYIEVAKSKGLDPFLGQIIPMVFSKNDPTKRKMTIIISRDGQRVIAQRCGDYRPADKPPTYEIDASLKGDTNPHGIVSATVYLWKQDAKTSAWYQVAGQAFWEEFAPLKDGAAFEWVESGETWPDSGKPKMKKKMLGETKLVLDDSGNWAKMPRLMISKVAEMQALRAGWPEQFGGLYAPEEFDRAAAMERTASEIVDAEFEEQRMKRIGAANSITFTWGDNWALEAVPVGQLGDRIAEHVEQTEPDLLRKWRDANAVPLREFWAKAPGDALAVKSLIEAKLGERAA